MWADLLVRACRLAWMTARRQGIRERMWVRGLLGAQWRVGMVEKGAVGREGIQREKARVPGCGEGGGGGGWGGRGEG